MRPKRFNFRLFGSRDIVAWSYFPQIEGNIQHIYIYIVLFVEFLIYIYIYIFIYVFTYIYIYIYIHLFIYVVLMGGTSQAAHRRWNPWQGRQGGGETVKIPTKLPYKQNIPTKLPYIVTHPTNATRRNHFSTIFQFVFMKIMKNH